MFTKEDYRYPLALTLVGGVGNTKAKQIIQHVGSAKAFFTEKKATLSKIPFVNQAILSQLNKEAALSQADTYLDYMAKHQYQLYYFQDKCYPDRLKGIDDAPVILYGKGKLEMNVAKTLAVVGTRNMTPYGKRICSELVETLQGSGITIISGLALGIDGEIHRGCLKHEIPTIGVLGHGLDRLYPDIHRNLAHSMLEQGGILTEFLPGTLPDKENFPKRNRIVAGMADAVVVVESGIKGGSLITCELANEYRKDVFAYPGDIFAPYSFGCNAIIARHKAHLLHSAQDLLRMMDWEKANDGKQSVFPFYNDLNEDEQCITDCLKDKKEVSIDGLSALTGFEFGKLSSTLLQLELRGFVLSLPAKRYKLAM